MVAYEDTVDWIATCAYPIGGGFAGPYDTWLYRRPITINNTSGGVLTNYQVLVELTPANHTYAHSEALGADIRFTQDDGTTPLDYWIEEWVEDGTSKIWVEIDSIPEGENVCGYLYYGKIGASCESNGNTTFLKFNGGTITGWDTITNNWTEEGGSLKNVGANLETARMNIGISDYIVEAIVQTPGKSAWQYLGIFGRRLDQDADTASQIFASIGANTGEYSMWKGDGWLNDGAYANIQLNTWYAIKMVLNGANVDFYGDPGQASATTLRLSTVAASVVSGACVGFASSNQANHLYDNFRVREYASTEPTNAVGEEAVSTIEPAILTTWAFVAIEWEANGAFETPTINFDDLIEWDAKGAVAMTTQGDYKSTIEWTVEGNFAPPHVFIFVDLR